VAGDSVFEYVVMLAHFDVDDFRALDRRILGLVQQGRLDRACGLLVETYGPEIIGTCVARVGDPHLGEDAAQDALVRAVQALPEYRGEAGLRPWLHRIAANRCIDLMRSRRSRRARTLDDYEVERLPAPPEPLGREAAEGAAAAREQLLAVRAAMASVKEPDRTWLELHYTHGVPYEDIADDAGLSRAAVKQRIWRAVKKVRALLGRTDGGES
jgi:RNA polymerase sigma-70 factor (ECF subfamily)